MADYEHKPATGLQTVQNFLGFIRALDASGRALAAEQAIPLTDATRLRGPIRAMLAERLPDMTPAEAWLLRHSIWEWRNIYQADDDSPLGLITLALEDFTMEATPRKPRDLIAGIRCFEKLTEEGAPPNEPPHLTSCLAALVYGGNRSKGDTFKDWHELRRRMDAE